MKEEEKNVPLLAIKVGDALKFVGTASDASIFGLSYDSVVTIERVSSEFVEIRRSSDGATRVLRRDYFTQTNWKKSVI